MLPWILVVACDCGSGNDLDRCVTASDCLAGQRCVDGRCLEGTDAGGTDAAPDGGGDGSVCATPCAGTCCAADEFCLDGICTPDFGSCSTSDDCSDDSYCEDGRCLPYGAPRRDRDDSCTRVIVAGTFAPTLQCEFRQAPPGDPFPDHLHVLSTPMVADFGIGRSRDGVPRPSIVAVFDDGIDGMSEQPTGVIRILDGATCEQQAELGSLQLTSHSSPPAVGDLTGDGRPEIVAFQAGGGVVAFTYDDGAGAWQVLWRSTTDGTTPFNPTGSGWSGPSIADLDDDGRPEVMRSGYVFDANGVLVDQTLGNLPGGGSTGVFAVVADVDGDGEVEHVQGHGVWTWDRTSRKWVAEPWSPGGTDPGHVALADFGTFPGGMDWPDDTPEVAVVSAGTVRLQTLDGRVVFGPVGIPGGGSGGPPTIADFDNDGVPEIGAAGATQYVVVDLDCTTSPAGGTCASDRTDGILWSQRSQDGSSNRTGSSVFDFEGDGRAEVVYGDECFLRVYDGESGEVVFSQSRSSCTWYENPVVADVDGDFNAEIVIGDNFNCGSADTGINCSGFGLDARQTDPLFAGLRCAEPSDCLSGNCDAGFCRCTNDDQCCSGLGCDRAGFVCEAPPAGTPGSGNTCRASRPSGTRGIRVYRDTADRWVSSRRVWNQHAYHVTNVQEDGTIPATSAARSNWTTPGLNNFRQNVQGDGRPDASPDLTARGAPIACDGMGRAELRSRVCNRGTEPVGDGLSVGFYDGAPSDATLLCRSQTATVLEPGDCEDVSCLWETPPTAPPGLDVTVMADDQNANGECFEGNNRSVLEGVRCSLLE